MPKKPSIFKATSFAMTKETYRQLQELSDAFGENNSQIMSRAIHALHFALRFRDVPLKDMLQLGDPNPSLEEVWFDVLDGRRKKSVRK